MKNQVFEPLLFDVPIPDIYHNTIAINGIQLQKRQMKTTSQGMKILSFFSRHPGENFTPFEVQERLKLQNTPITSIRRALTNLTPSFLVKTDIKRPGIYGDLNYTWTLKILQL